MKKILMVLLAAIIICQSAVFAQATEQTRDDFSNMLAALGVEKAATGNEKEVTKADFVLYMSDLAGTTIPEASGKSPYYDVSKTNEAYDEIMYFCNSGILGYNTENFFKPKSKITISEATEFIVRLMGYKDKLLNNTSPQKVAADLGMFKNIKTNNNTVLTYEILNKMVYNLLDAPVVIYSNDSNKTYSIDKSRTLLSERLEAEKIKGIVTDNGITALDGKTGCSEESVEINHISYLKNDVDVIPYLGMNVEAYIRRNTNDEPYLVYIQGYKNDVVTLSADEIENSKTTLKKLAYLKSNTVKYLKLENGIDYVYNGKAKALASVEDLKINNGTITLVDNNNNGIYDVVLVNEYSNVFVSSIDVKNKKVYDDYKKVTLLLDENEVAYHLYKEGMEITLEDLQAEDVLLVYKSDDGEYVNIYVASGSFEGSITGVNTRDYKTVITVGGKKYTVADDCNRVPEIGYNGEFWCNSEGEIVVIEQRWGDGDSYAYLKKVYMSDDKSKCVVRMFTTNGMIEDIECGKKIKIDGRQYKIANTVCENLTPFEGQFVKYAVNKKDELTMIDTTTVDAGGDDDTFALYANKISKGYRPNGIFDHTFAINSDTIVMVIPDDEDDIEEFQITSQAGFTGDTAYTVSAYDVSDGGIAKFVVKYGDAAEITEYALINDVYLTVDDNDELMYEIETYDGKKLKADKDGNDGIKNLEKGDLITYKTSYDELKSWSIIVKKSSFNTSANTSYGSYSSLYFSGVGIVLTEEESIYRVKYDDNNTELISLNSVPVYLVEGKEIDEISDKEIRVGDKVFWYNRNVGATKYAVVYR